MPTNAKQNTPKPPNASLVRKTSHLTAKMINGVTTAIRKRASKRSIRCLNRLGVLFSIGTSYYNLLAKSVKLGAASSSMMAGAFSFAMAVATTSCFASTPPAMRITSFFVLADALLFNT